MLMILQRFQVKAPYERRVNEITEVSKLNIAVSYLALNHLSFALISPHFLHVGIYASYKNNFT